MSPPPARRRSVSRRRPAAWAVLAALACAQCGCVNLGVMFGKVVFGDPKQMSLFEQRTGVSLIKGETKVALVCTAPASISGEFDSLETTLQAEVLRQMRLQGIDTIRPNEIASALDGLGGKFDRDGLARALPEADYILHVDIEQFAFHEDSSPDLFHGRANGIIYAYEVDRENESSGRPRVLQVFYDEFNAEYPRSQPVSADQMPPRVFQRRFVAELSRVVGALFYDVTASDLFL